jgi:hypothetical protein
MGERGANYYGSETLSATSFATCDDVAFFSLFERDDNCHACLWTGGNRSILGKRVRSGQITSANTIGGSGLNRVIQVAGRFEF